MSQVMIYKTRRVSGNGELIADTIAKGNMNNLLSLGVNLSLSVKPSRVLSDYVKKPNVDCMSPFWPKGNEGCGEDEYVVLRGRKCAEATSHWR